VELTDEELCELRRQLSVRKQLVELDSELGVLLQRAKGGGFTDQDQKEYMGLQYRKKRLLSPSYDRLCQEQEAKNRDLFQERFLPKESSDSETTEAKNLELRGELNGKHE
jgi:hypothetical protein